MTQSAGKRDRLITIQTRTTAQNANGEDIETWSAFSTQWVSINPLSGSEYVYAKQISSTVTHQVELLYVAGVTTTMRIAYGSRTLFIESVLELDRRAGLRLLCREDV